MMGFMTCALVEVQGEETAGLRHQVRTLCPFHANDAAPLSQSAGPGRARPEMIIPPALRSAWNRSVRIAFCPLNWVFVQSCRGSGFPEVLCQTPGVVTGRTREQPCRRARSVGRVMNAGAALDWIKVSDHSVVEWRWDQALW